MQVKRSEEYLAEIQDIILYIAKDSIDRALKFQYDLDCLIDDISDMPYKFRQSTH